MRNQYAMLNPRALGIASGIAALVVGILSRLGTMGAVSMMGAGPVIGGPGSPNGPGWMMHGRGWMGGGYGPYGYTMSVGWSLFMLLAAFIAGALVGWIIALLYNRLLPPSASDERPA